MTEEQVSLRDGTVVLIRPVGPADTALLADGFARLSAASRELRFLGPRNTLSESELRHLTSVDHHAHEALVALDPRDRRGLGVARYIRHADDPQCAEFAVAVVDDCQGRGLGGLLTQRLIQRAREEGVQRFSALVARGNAPSVELLRAAGASVRVAGSDRYGVEYEMTLPAGDSGPQVGVVLGAYARQDLASPPPIRDCLNTLIPTSFTGSE